MTPRALDAFELTRDRPCHVLAHERRRIIGARAQRRDNRSIGLRVAESHREIARPALIPDAPDRAAFHPRVELGFGPREQRQQIRIVETVAYTVEILLVRSEHIAIPWTDELAVVATIDAIADQRPQRFRDAAFQFDREIGNAASRIELVGRDDRAGRTNLDALRARAAVRRRR